MNVRVKRKIIDDWLDLNFPNALAKLSVESGVPASAIAKIRLGEIPHRRGHRVRLSKFLGVQEDVLFPLS